jgi:hypothetical protein
MPSRIERKKSAYHEAGHAVIAWYYNNPPLYVSIIQEGDILGGCRTRRKIGKVFKPEAHQFERELDITMAGAAAVEQLTGKKITGTGWGGDDYINGVKMAEQWAKITGNALDDVYLVDMSIDVDGITGCLFSGAFLDDFGGHVRELMTRPHIWECVVAVARELLKKTELTGEELSDLISKTWNEMDGDEQEGFIEDQRSDDDGRPWGEWWPE